MRNAGKNTLKELIISVITMEIAEGIGRHMIFLLEDKILTGKVLSTFQNTYGSEGIGVFQ